MNGFKWKVPMIPLSSRRQKLYDDLEETMREFELGKTSLMTLLDKLSALIEEEKKDVVRTQGDSDKPGQSGQDLHRSEPQRDHGDPVDG